MCPYKGNGVKGCVGVGENRVKESVVAGKNWAKGRVVAGENKVKESVVARKNGVKGSDVAGENMVNMENMVYIKGQ